MWEATLRVTREQKVDADPERVWALLAVPAALSAMPGHRFAFAVPAEVPGTDRLCCLIVADRDRARCAVLDVREQVPGELIRWQTRSTLPAGKEAMTLSVRPRPGGCELSVVVDDVTPRESKASKQAHWKRTIKAWADNLRAVIEGRAPWPPAGLPAEVREACAGRPLRGKTAQANGGVLIDAAADAVWEMVWAPETSLRVEPDRLVWAGRVPGTPRRAVGEMRCFVTRYPDDRFRAQVHVVTELTEGRRAVTRHIGPPGDEVLHVVTPTDGGTRLDLTARWPAGQVKKKDAAHAAADRVARHLQAQAEACKAIIEKAADRPDEQ